MSSSSQAHLAATILAGMLANPECKFSFGVDQPDSTIVRKASEWKSPNRQQKFAIGLVQQAQGLAKMLEGPDGAEDSDRNNQGLRQQSV